MLLRLLWLGLRAVLSLLLLLLLLLG